MTEPTDAELDEFLDSPGNMNWVIADKRERFRLFARAVLAKWGAPPAVAGEPFAWADDGSLRSGSTEKAYRVVTNETKRDMPKAAADSFNTPLYTTPQPSQAQAGAVPLTRERVKAILTECGYDGASAQHRADFINGLRHGEAAHGITKTEGVRHGPA